MAYKAAPKKNGMVGTPRGYVPARSRNLIDKNMDSYASKAAKALNQAVEFVWGDQSAAEAKLNIAKDKARIRKIAKDKAIRMTNGKK